MATQTYYMNIDLATGNNDGSDEANAFQSTAAFEAAAYDLQSAGDDVVLYVNNSSGSAIGYWTHSTTWNPGASNTMNIICTDDWGGLSFDNTKTRIYVADPGSSGCLAANLPYVRYANWQIENGYTGDTANRHTVVVSAASVTLDGFFLKGSGSGNGSIGIKTSGSSTSGCVFQRGVITGMGYRATELNNTSSGSANRAMQVTAYNNGHGFFGNNDYKVLPIAQNCVSFGNGTEDWDSTTSGEFHSTSSTNNASYDGSHPGTSGVTLTSNTVTDYFTSATDFHIDTGATYYAEIDNDGVDLSTYFTTDAEGDTIVNWPIGADALVSGGGSSIIPISNLLKQQMSN